MQAGWFSITLLEITLTQCIRDLKKFISFDPKIPPRESSPKELWEVWKRFVYKESHYSINYKSKNIGEHPKSLTIREWLYKLRHIHRYNIMEPFLWKMVICVKYDFIYVKFICFSLHTHTVSKMQWRKIHQHVNCGYLWIVGLWIKKFFLFIPFYVLNIIHWL